MPLAPEIQLSDDESRVIETCEARIDRTIRDHYVDQAKISVDTGFADSAMTEKVKHVLRTRYQAAGWSEVLFTWRAIVLKK